MADITFNTLSDATTVGTGNASDGSGNFDELMQVVTLHLEDQFAAGRITGTDYANVYLGALQSTLDQAVSFTLSMEKANADVDLIGKQDALVTQQKLTEVQNTTLVTNKAATESKQALDIEAATTLKGKQGLLVDAQELQADAQTVLITNQATTELTAQTTSETTAVKQRLDIVASTALKGKQESLVDKQILTEEKQALDIAGATSLKAKQALTQEKQALDLVGSTSLKAKQALTQEKQALDLVGATSLKSKQALTEEKKALDLVSSTSVRNTQSNNDASVKAAQTLKIGAEKDLLIQKKYTEYAQTGNTSNAAATATSVIGKQNLLFEQAKGFKWNAEAKYLKSLLDAYAINVSVSKEADADTDILQGGDSNTGIDKIISDMEPTDP